ncbi:MAG: hypothetical protein ACRBK7_07100 [Acidimicrobiales bacterium]
MSVLDRCGPEWLRSDRGSIVPLLAVVLLVLAMVTGTIGLATQHYVRLARAQWAADAAALASAAVGLSGSDIDSARALAEANGAELVSVSVVDPTGGSGAGPTPLSSVVVVEVELGGLRARSAARRFAMAEG